MTFTNHWEEEILDHVFGIGSYTAPTIYVGLHKGTSTLSSDSTTPVEPSAASYARIEVSAWTRSGSTITNTSDIEFDIATEDWTTGSDEIKSVVLWNHLTNAVVADNYLAYGSVSTSKPIQEDDQAKILAGQLSITLD